MTTGISDNADGVDARPGRVLAVDDEPSILFALRRLLHRHGFDVLLANSAQEGLEMLAHQDVDVVLSDMRMPGMDGAEFLEQVFLRWPQTKRILLTGYSEVNATVAAINRGKIWRYIAKPWDDEDLLLAVRQAIGHRRLMDENVRLQALTTTQNDELKQLNAELEARVAARTQALQQALADLHQAFVGTVRVFANILDLRGGMLAGHSRRVADNARKVAQRLGLSDQEAQEVFLAGLLHDIGKIGLPDATIERPFNNLGPEVRAEVMKHPEKGETLLMPVRRLSGVARLVRHHHEHFDGTGFPDRLSGMEIPLGARILAVVNDFDAVQIGTLVARPLRPADALRFIVENAGRRYDPAIVDTFSKVLADETQADEFAEVPLRPSSLQPGMRLTRDLLHHEGYLLLARDHVLSQPEITQLLRLEAAEERPLTLYVVSASESKA